MRVEGSDLLRVSMPPHHANQQPKTLTFQQENRPIELVNGIPTPVNLVRALIDLRPTPLNE